MSASVLVAYATRYGSTQEVAESVAATLRECGLEVDIGPMRDVRTLDQYRSVVLGAPLYMMHWHKDALHFLARHREALTARPVAIFALGPQKLTFPHNLVPALKNMPASDIRDWTAIRAWANDLVAQFQPALA